MPSFPPNEGGGKGGLPGAIAPVKSRLLFHTMAKDLRASFESLSAFAYDHLVNRLLSRELVPGDLLNRRQIAKELHISVAPVAEAMLQLQADGFLESIPRKGTLVKSIRKEDLRGQILLREALECEGARLYCGRKLRERLEEFNRLADEVEATRNSPDYWEWEIRFHRALLELAECPALLEVYDKVMRRQLFMAQNFLLPAHTGSERHDHRRLLEELSAGKANNARSADKAAASLRRHIRSGKLDILGLPPE